MLGWHKYYWVNDSIRVYGIEQTTMPIKLGYCVGPGCRASRVFTADDKEFT